MKVVQLRDEDVFNDTTIKILVVDDEYKITKRLFSLYFRRNNELNLEFRFAENGRSALAEIDKAPFDVIITDIRMPEMDGIELLRRIQSRGERIVSIIMTAYDAADYQIDAADLGVIKIIPKPIDFSLLVAAIQQGLILSNRLYDED